jgi:hypothetical protein
MCDTTADRVRLIHAAAASNLSNCFDWLDDIVQRNVRQRDDLRGLTLSTIKRLAREWIADHNGRIYERPGSRPVDSGRRDYWYYVIVPVNSTDDFPRGLFVEMELEEPYDTEFPVVYLLNAHPERDGPRLPPGGVFLS